MTFAPALFDGICAFGLLLLATLALNVRDLLSAISWHIVFGILLGVVWVRLRAPDIALAEVNLARALEILKQAGLWVVGLDGGARATLRGIGLGRRRAALVLGAEGEGLRRNVRAHCDELARLPMLPGAVESLNVSVAAAVALYEITVERLEKGETP